jgi:hypothetical protein
MRQLQSAVHEIAPEASHESAAAAAVAAPPTRASSISVSTTGSSVLTRLTWAFFFLAPVIVFAIAAFLTPNPHGHGTHTQLGLPPCGFLVVTGLPCPGCGLTTCFAYMIRGQVVDATTANPFGVMLFLVSAATAAVAAVGFVRNWPVIQTLDKMHAEKWAILLSAGSLTVWVVRIVTILADL